MYSLACLRQPRYEPVKLQLWLANSFACCSVPSSKVQISFIDRRIHFADSKARPAALFFVSRKGGGRRQERFDHLHRYCDSGIAVTSSARPMSASGAKAERREVYPFQLPFLFEQDKDWIMG